MTTNNALQLVQLGQLVDNVAESAYKGLQNLGQTLPALPDEERYYLTLIRCCSSSNGAAQLKASSQGF